MKSSTTKRFRKHLAGLPPEIRKIARKQFRLWIQSPHHPSLQFKKVGPYWSVRINRDYRALGVQGEGRMVWFFVGRHGEYEQWL
jgi:hypothetical protein